MGQGHILDGGGGRSDAHTWRGNFEGKNGPDQVDILKEMQQEAEPVQCGS